MKFRGKEGWGLSQARACYPIMCLKILYLPMKKAIFLLLTAVAGPGLLAQDSDLLPNSPVVHFVDRIDILGLTGTTIHTDVKPLRRQALTEIFQAADVSSLSGRDLDWFHRMRILADDEFAKGKVGKKPLLKYFYQNSRNLFSINKDDFNLYVDPILYLSMGVDQSKDSSGSEMLVNYRNTRGIRARGDIFRKVGFFTEVTENQWKAPQFVRNEFNRRDVLFGETFVKQFDDSTQLGGVGYDYFSARGYITFSPVKNIRFKLGKDRAFWGNGYQSLFLNDFAADHFMLDINAKLLDFEYTYHLGQFVHYIPNKPDGYGTFPRKYGVFHQLSWKPNRNLSFSAFESVIYSPTLPGDQRGFELEYLNPIIFFRSVEQYLGSPDNSMLGAAVKVNFLHRFQGYSQFLLDDLNFRNRANGKGYWGNKYGWQFGLKWINAFFVPRLDLQVEYNRIRPFTYSHFNPVAAFGHYGQHLGHAQGANLWDFNLILRYQPFPRWSGEMVFTTLTKGLDQGGINYGGDPFRSYILHVGDYNNFIGQGNTVRINSLYGRISFQPFHNEMYLDGELRVRKEGDLTSAIITGSFRMDIPNKQVKF